MLKKKTSVLHLVVPGRASSGNWSGLYSATTCKEYPSCGSNVQQCFLLLLYNSILSLVNCLTPRPAALSKAKLVYYSL